MSSRAIRTRINSKACSTCVGATSTCHPRKAAGVLSARRSGHDGSRPAASSGTLAGRPPLSESGFAAAAWRRGGGILTPTQCMCVCVCVCVCESSSARLAACCALSWPGCCQGRRTPPALGRVSVPCFRSECRGCGAGAGAAGGRRAAAGYAPGRRHTCGRVPAAAAAVQVTACTHLGSFKAYWQKHWATSAVCTVEC
jgi:hypothetical protein